MKQGANMKTTLLHHKGSTQIGVVSMNTYTYVMYSKQRAEQNQNQKMKEQVMGCQ